MLTVKDIEDYEARKERRQMLTEMVSRMAEKDLTKGFTSGCESTTAANTVTTVDITFDSLKETWDKLPKMPPKKPQTVIIGTNEKIKQLERASSKKDMGGDVLPCFGGYPAMFCGMPVYGVDSEADYYEMIQDLKTIHGEDVIIILLCDVNGDGYAINVTALCDLSWPNNEDGFPLSRE